MTVLRPATNEARLEATAAQRLLQPGAHGLRVLSAPGGFGKSWVLAQVLQAWPGPPPLEWTLHSAVTLHQALRSFCRLFGQLSVPPSLDAESAADIALNAMAQGPAQAALVIDLDGATPSAAVLLLVGRILPDAAAQRTVLLACRSARSVPLDRLKRRVPVELMRATDLALSPEETAAAQGLSLAQVQRWWPLTQGWPVLCSSPGIWSEDDGMSASADTALDRIVDAFADYMEHELLAPLPAADLQVLMQCALFEVIEPGVLEATRLGALWPRLVALVEAGIPVSEADSDWDRIVLLPVFRRYLQRRLRAHAPALYHALQRRAAPYFAAAGQPREALRHAAATGDAAFEAQINELCGGWRISWREGLQALDCDGAACADLSGRFPKAALARIYWQAQTGRVESAAAALAHLKTRPLAASLQGDVTAVEAVIAVYRDEPFDETWLARLGEWIESPSDDDPLLLPGRATLQAAMLNCAGLYERAASTARGSIVGAAAAKSAYVEFYGQLQYGLALHGLGRVGEAVPVYGRARELAAELFGAGGGPHRIVGLLGAHNAWLAGHDEPPEAADGLDDIYRLHAWFEPYARLLQLALALALQRGDEALQERVLQNFDDLAERRGQPRLKVTLQAARAQREAALGRFDAAVLACERGLALAEAGTAAPASRARVLAPLWLQKARIAIARLRYDDAAEALAQFRLAMSTVHDGANELEALLFEACVALRARRYRDAAQGLTQAVKDAERSGLRRPFLDNAALVLELAGYLRAHAVSIDAKVLQRAAELAQPTGAAPAPADSPRRRPGHGARLLLTERETDILHFLAEGLSSKEIARRLTIAEGTVKTHRKHLYEKLETSARSQALRRAREIGLL